VFSPIIRGLVRPRLFDVTLSGLFPTATG